jgi:hypothetical protein
MTTITPLTVPQASERLYEAMTHHFGPMDLAASDPLVIAISEYGQRSREGDDTATQTASKHVYEALTRHQGNRDFDAHDPLVIAIAEYKDACRAAGPRN